MLFLNKLNNSIMIIIMLNRSTTMKEKNINLNRTNASYLNTQQQNLNRSYADKPKIINQQDSTIVYSLKPVKYSIPKDVPVVEIFKLIRKGRYDEEKIVASLELTIQDKANRTKYIEKMKLFILCEKFPYSIVSYSIYYMDLLISKMTQLPLEHIFIGSMILAIKYYSIETRLFLLKRVQKFMKDTSQKIYEIDELLEIEIKCLMHLNYKLNWIHTHHFIQMLLLNGVVFNSDVSQNSNATGSNIYDIIYDIMDSIYETGSYFPFDSFYLSCAIVTLAREICGFIPWSAFLGKVFSVDLHQFENYLSSLKASYNSQTRNSSPPRTTKEIKASTTVKKKQEEEDAEFSQIKKSNQVELLKSADKGVKNKSISFKLSFHEINKVKEESIIQSQRTINDNKKQLGVIKENDINSTEDNSFVSMNDNLNKTVMFQKEHKNREKERFHVMMFQGSSKNIIKKDVNNQQEEIKLKSNYKHKIENDDKERESSLNNELAENKKDIKKKGTISLSRQFNYPRINTTQDKSYHGDKRLNRKDQLNNTEDAFISENNKFHCKFIHKK